MSEYATCTKCGTDFYRDEPWKKICMACWRETNGRSRSQYRRPQYSPTAAPVTKVMLSKMIRLCHPDKHNNSDTANEVTTFLLSLRKGK